jgi:hypothetical protein
MESKVKKLPLQPSKSLLVPFAFHEFPVLQSTPPDTFCPLLSIYAFIPLSFIFVRWMSPFYFVVCLSICISTLSQLLLLSASDNSSHFTLFSLTLLLHVISSTSLLFWELFRRQEYFFWLYVVLYAVKWGAARAGLCQCLSTAGPQPSTRPWHQLYRPAAQNPALAPIIPARSPEPGPGTNSTGP